MVKISFCYVYFTMMRGRERERERERERQRERERDRDRGSSPQFQGKLLYTAKKLSMYQRQTFLWEKRWGFTNDSACLQLSNFLISTCS